MDLFHVEMINLFFHTHAPIHLGSRLSNEGGTKNQIEMTKTIQQIIKSTNDLLKGFS